MPHDLWAAADLPAISLADRITLIAVQFDLTFHVSAQGHGLKLVPLPDNVGLVRMYPGGRRPDATADQYTRLAPGAQVKVVGNEVYVRALLEDHDRLVAPARPAEHPATTTAGDRFARKRFTLTIQGHAAASVLRQLADQLKLDLRIDHQALQQAGISLQQPISVDVKDATVDALLREVVEPIGLQCRRRGDSVEIGTPE